MSPQDERPPSTPNCANKDRSPHLGPREQAQRVSPVRESHPGEGGSPSPAAQTRRPLPAIAGRGEDAVLSECVPASRRRTVARRSPYLARASGERSAPSSGPGEGLTQNKI